MEALKEWHDFYLVVGTAAATLIGAMFVVVSIGSGLINKDRGFGLSIYTTPTVMHLAVVVFACALIFVPSLSERGLGVLLGSGAGGGLAYAARNTFHIIRRKPFASDLVWHGVVPVIAYLVGLAGAVFVFLGRPHALDLLAIALALLVASGIRNAWDLIIFFVLESRDST